MSTISDLACEYHAGRKGNCSQSVAAGYFQKTGQGEEYIEKFSGFGGGRAPEGYCGALYAAMQILGDDKK